MYEGIHVEMVYTNRYDENSDLSTTYLGQTKMTRDMRIKADYKFHYYYGAWLTSGKSLDSTECQFF